MSLAPQQGPLTKDAYDSQEVRAAILFVQVGVVLYEHALALPWEWSVVSGRRSWQWPMAFYFVGRLSVLAATCLRILLYRAPRMDCNSAFRLLVCFSILEVVGGAGILSIRCLALYQWGKPVSTLLAVAWAVYVAASATTLTGFSDHYVPSPDGGDGHCVLSTLTATWSYIFAFSCIMIIDIIVALLITVKLVQQRHSTASAFSMVLVRDSLLYAFVNAVPTLTTLILLATNADGVVTASCIGTSAAVHAVGGCRAMIHLSKVSERLPSTLKVAVSNGALLDHDTLSRIAWFLNPDQVRDYGPGPSDDVVLSPSGRSLFSPRRGPSASRTRKPSLRRTAFHPRSSNDLSRMQTQRVTGEGRKEVESMFESVRAPSRRSSIKHPQHRHSGSVDTASSTEVHVAHLPTYGQGSNRRVLAPIIHTVTESVSLPGDVDAPRDGDDTVEHLSHFQNPGEVAHPSPLYEARLRDMLAAMRFPAPASHDTAPP